ncbi:MAG: formylglycine-generating enzyme family protein [Phycisphaerales bacterium]
MPDSTAARPSLVHLAAIGAIVGLAAATVSAQPAHAPSLPAPADAEPLEPITITIPGTAIDLTLIPLPAGSLTYAEMDHLDRPIKADIEPFYIATTEITWDLYDVFVFALDQPDPTTPDDADVVARPSKPYLPPDRGFGHAGYPALSMTHHAAEQFCIWLSNKTGLAFRLPTENEWEYACRAGADTAYCFGDDQRELADHAWYIDSADWTTHPVATLEASAFGLFDMHGNAAEWVNGRDGTPLVAGGSYLDEANAVAANSRERQTRDWQASDPQIPRSRWWLADATHVGFRVVCDGPIERDDE